MVHTPPSERTQEPTPPPPKRHRLWRRIAVVGGVLIVGYLGVAYVALPMFWLRYTRHHPALADLPHITHTVDGIPGDPLNVAPIGMAADLKRVMRASQWDPADPLTLRSRLEIAEAAVFEHPYDDAPVSDLFLWGRKEDLAFEPPVGNDPRQYYLVRFWRAATRDPDSRPLWVGAATFDQRVGLSHTTGQITHQTAPDIDAERAKLFADLQHTGDLAEVSFIDGFHQIRYVLVEVGRRLYAHPKIDSASARVRFVRLGSSSLDLEVFSYITVTDFGEYLEVAEDLNLRIMDIVAAAGSSFAFPSQTTYVEQGSGLDADRARAAKARVRPWHERGELYLPRFPPEKMAEIDNTLAYPPDGSITGPGA